MPKSDDPLIEKMRRWIFIGLVALVGGGALIMIILKLITKVF